MDARVSPSRTLSCEPWVRHLANFLPLLAITLCAGVLGFARATVDAPILVRLTYALVVALNVLVVAMSSWSTVLGLLARLSRWLGYEIPGPLAAAPTGRARTAVVFAIHEEDAARVFAAARVMADDVSQDVGTLDVFVLSDSRSALSIAAEEAMLARCASVADGPRIFYRRRAHNRGRKAGNIADFIERWGAAYDFMVVLDADSLMSGACVARLVGMMEANPRAGLIQAMCYPVGRTSIFARIQQFDARLVGPVFQSGVALWQGPRGSFWGHNAIVRPPSFAASCGLPVLPGRPPLGGDIISHDTVEAAFLLRAGFDVWMVPDGPDGRPDGSWEETPTNLLDHLVRDKRWLQGNLQHLAVLSAQRLKPASIYHLVRGLSHFLYAPLLTFWLCLYAILDQKAAPDALMLLLALLILAPRAIGLAVALCDGESVGGFGGRSRLVIGTLVDQAFVALLYPVVLVAHLAFLVSLPFGGTMHWDGQARGERSLRWRETGRRLGPTLGAASLVLLPLAVVAPLPVALLGPSLLLAIPLAVVTSRLDRWKRLFATPEDASVHPLRVERERLETSLRQAADVMRCGKTISLPPENGLAMPTQRLRASASAM